MRISDWSSDVCSSDLLDIILPLMRRGLEHHDIAALRRMRHYPSRDQRQAARQAIKGIAVGPFGNQQIIANKQARLQGFRGDVEGRDNKNAPDENEEDKLHEEKQEIPDFRNFTH